MARQQSSYDARTAVTPPTRRPHHSSTTNKEHLDVHIHILGGGIGGMSAALLAAQTAEANVGVKPSITIYERSSRYGGKAVSQFPPGPSGGLLPGEHGFRFFPNFYRCIIDTLRRIPLTEEHVRTRALRSDLAGQRAFDALVETGESGIAISGSVLSVERSTSLAKLPGALLGTLRSFNIAARDFAVLNREFVRFIVSCDERAVEDWDGRTLREFAETNNFGAGMMRFLGSLRSLSAMRADRGSLRTLLGTAVQMVVNFDSYFSKWDAVLPGPTDYLMLEPWAAELDRLGVRHEFDTAVEAIEFHTPDLGKSSVRSVDLSTGKRISASDKDIFVLALPYEVSYRLITSEKNVPKELAGMKEIPQHSNNLGDGSAPMVGVQFFLKRKLNVARGHILYPDAPWAMTSISQGQFWEETFTRPLSDVFGVDELKDVVSAIVSAWDVEAPRIGKAPMNCSPDELAKEAFAQLLEGLGGDLSWNDVIAYHIDSDIEFSEGRAHCTTPLWVSPKGSYLHRPEADPGMENLFIASDWARTDTDVGSMESADESARLAVRGIFQRHSEATEGVPTIRRFRLWRGVESAKRVDRWLHRNKLPSAFSMKLSDLRELITALKNRRTHGESAAVALTANGVTYDFTGMPIDDDLDKAIEFLELFSNQEGLIDAPPEPTDTLLQAIDDFR